MLLLMLAAQGVDASAPAPVSYDPIGSTNRAGARDYGDESAAVGTYHRDGHRRFARVILPILALLFLDP